MSFQHVYVIAEVGVNHNGDCEKALELVYLAKKSGADAVKFQTFKAERLVTKTAEKAAYQKQTTESTESQYEMIRKLEMSDEDFGRIKALCADLSIDFLSTAFDSKSLDFLVDKMDVKTLKVGSGELSNSPLLLDHARKGRNIILSTGMATLSDIEQALSVLAFGLTETGETAPSIDAFSEAYASLAGQAALKDKVTVLQCTTEYPTPYNEVNLNTLKTLSTCFNLSVGFSDHTLGIVMPVAAVALGAIIIEKHITLSRDLPGPDHMASLNPEEFASMVEGIRQVEIGLGSPVKKPSPSEVRNKSVARKSLVAVRSIKKGDKFTNENMGVKRPASGISPVHYWDFLGKEADRDFSVDELLVLGH